jgi:AAA+ ATPase superfamily predicted ATPase
MEFLVRGKYLHRDCEELLGTWLGKETRKPLIIRGSRQTGKSTLVREFARSKNLNFVEVNIEEHFSFIRSTLNCRWINFGICFEFSDVFNASWES